LLQTNNLKTAGRSEVMLPIQFKKRRNQASLPVVEDKTLLEMHIEDLREFNGPLLSHQEEMELGYRIRLGDVEAYLEMFRKNTRLVLSIAKQNRYRGLTVGFELVDLIQEGYIGLLTAIVRYDPDRGYKFSTYAVYWIWQRISRALDDGGIIRVPIYLRTPVRKVSRAIIDLLEMGRKNPRVEDIVELTELSPQQVKTALDVLNYKTAVLSLDRPSPHDDERTLADKVVDHLAANDLEEAERKGLGISARLGKILSPREQLVIELRFGLRGREYTLEEVGRELGVTRERIRQIQSKATLKLWGSGEFRSLFEAMTGKKPDSTHKPLSIMVTGKRGSRGNGAKETSRDGLNEILGRWKSHTVKIERRELNSYPLQ
jgi:RNA polymerase primary sigma factor